jgi:hypothetical protein
MLLGKLKQCIQGEQGQVKQARGEAQGDDVQDVDYEEVSR